MLKYLIRHELVSEEKAPSQHFLAEGDYVHGLVQIPVLVRPELPGRTTPGLDLINLESTAMLPGSRLENPKIN